jgi:hypothetical protein
MSRMLPEAKMNPRETAVKLIAQAIDKSVTLEESRSFALKAVKFIAEHKLLDNEASAVDKAKALWESIPIERLSSGANKAALMAAAMEITRLTIENTRLKADNAHLEKRVRKLLRRIRG